MQVAIVTTGRGAVGRRGRPRKANVRRRPSGKSEGEVIDLEFFQKQPHRRGWEKTSVSPLDALHGSALGRLRVRELISDEQLRAGNEWGHVVATYRRMLLAPPGSPRSGQIADRVSSGTGGDAGRKPDPEEEVKRFQSLRDRYDAAFEALWLLDRTLGTGISAAVRKVCVDDRDCTEGEIGNLRCGLNGIGKVLFQER